VSSLLPGSSVLNKEVVNVIGNRVGSGPLKTVSKGAETADYIVLYSSGIELNEVMFKINTAA